MNQFLTKETSLQILLVDNYDICITGTEKLLKERYPKAKLTSTQTASEAFCKISNLQPDLIIMDILLSENPGFKAQTLIGLELLQRFLENYPRLNILGLAEKVRKQQEKD